MAKSNTKKKKNHYNDTIRIKETHLVVKIDSVSVWVKLNRVETKQKTENDAKHMHIKINISYNYENTEI